MATERWAKGLVLEEPELDDMAAGKGNEMNEDGCERQKDRRSSNTMNEMRMQCTIGFLFNWCTYTRENPLEYNGSAQKPWNVASVKDG